MKIFVGLKQVPDPLVSVPWLDDQTLPDFSGVKPVINPFDEIALEAAVQLKEQGIAKEVIAFSVGVVQVSEMLRTALALGADRALLAEISESTILGLKPMNLVEIFQYILTKKVSADLILLGKMAVDSENQQTGALLAERLNIPFVSSAVDLKCDSDRGRITVTKETDYGLECVEIPYPAIISCDLRLNEPRYASLPNILKAKRKPLEVEPIDPQLLTSQNHWHIEGFSSPPQRPRGKTVASVTALVEALVSDGVLS
ncbi:electron transfer flavoprotein subunit beta/FixA family protein [Magnetococcales bacterium HHB-1]